MAKRTDTGSETLNELYAQTGTLIERTFKNLGTVPKTTRAINIVLKDMGFPTSVTESMMRHWLVNHGYIAPFQKVSKEPPKAPPAKFDSLSKLFPQYEWHWFTAQYPRVLDSGEFCLWARLGESPNKKALDTIALSHPDTVIASRVLHRNGNSGVAIGIPKQLDSRAAEPLLTLD